MWNTSTPLGLSVSKPARCLVPLFLLAACSQSAPDADDGEPIYCALGGASAFTDTCRLERTTIDARPLLVVRHPDGGFRRLQVSPDGQHLDAVDGADTAQSALKEGRYEVILGGDKYVIPVKADARPQ